MTCFVGTLAFLCGFVAHWSKIGALPAVNECTSVPIACGRGAIDDAAPFRYQHPPPLWQLERGNCVDADTTQTEIETVIEALEV